MNMEAEMGVLQPQAQDVQSLQKLEEKRNEFRENTVLLTPWFLDFWPLELWEIKFLLGFVCLFLRGLRGWFLAIDKVYGSSHAGDRIRATATTYAMAIAMPDP